MASFQNSLPLSQFLKTKRTMMMLMALRGPRISIPAGVDYASIAVRRTLKHNPRMISLCLNSSPRLPHHSYLFHAASFKSSCSSSQWMGQIFHWMGPDRSRSRNSSIELRTSSFGSSSKRTCSGSNVSYLTLRYLVPCKSPKQPIDSNEYQFLLNK